MIVRGFYKEDDDLGCLSNWHHSSFEYAGVYYNCAEQFMMYQKAMLFDDEPIAKEILATEDTFLMKQLGRKVHNYNDLLWRKLSYRIMYKGLKAKFLQNPELRETLLNTGNDILAECAPRDFIWGIGMGKDNPDLQDTSKWRGSNKLGILLMDVRSSLRGELAIFGNYKYVDGKDRDFEEWNMRAGDLRRNNEYYAVIHTYVDSFENFDKEEFYYARTLHEWEEMLRNDPECKLPMGGFYELKQELFDLSRLNVDSYQNRYAALPIITKREVAWKNSGRDEFGMITMGAPEYDEETRNWLGLLDELNLLDENYLKNYDDVMGKDYNSLSAEQILTVLTFAIRSERFNPGALARMIEDGSVEKLGRRLRKLTRK